MPGFHCILKLSNYNMLFSLSYQINLMIVKMTDHNYHENLRVSAKYVDYTVIIYINIQCLPCSARHNSRTISSYDMSNFSTQILQLRKKFIFNNIEVMKNLDGKLQRPERVRHNFSKIIHLKCNSQ